MRRLCDTSGTSTLGEPRAPHGFLFRFSVLFCGLRLAVRLAFDSLDYSTHSAICQDEIFIAVFPIWKQVAVHLTVWIIAHIRLFVKRNFVYVCFRFGNKPLFIWQFGLYHALPVLSTMNLDFFKRILEFTEIVLISVCFELYYSYFSVQMFCILGIWDKVGNCKPEFWLNRFTI